MKAIDDIVKVIVNILTSLFEKVLFIIYKNKVIIRYLYFKN